MIKNPEHAYVETLSPDPVAKPLNLRVPSQTDRIMALIRHEQARAALDREVETFEESDDFDLDDGEQWFSPYEENFEPAPEPVTPPAPPAPPADPPASPEPTA